MRTILPLLALLALLPSATAIAAPLPAYAHVDPTLPGDDGCADCAGAEVRAGAYMPNCFDCPSVGASLGVLTEGGKPTTVTARVCYSSFYVLCLVDESVGI